MTLMLTGCGPKAESPDLGADSRIACQPAGAERLERVCTVERALSDEGLVLVVRQPDGSFRRLLVVKDGRGVIAADGAEPATVRLADTIGDGREIEVTLGGDRYILPATVRAEP